MIDGITSTHFQILIEEQDYFSNQASSVPEVKNKMRIQLKVYTQSTLSCARSLIISYFPAYQKLKCVYANLTPLECQIALIK